MDVSAVNKKLLAMRAEITSKARLTQDLPVPERAADPLDDALQLQATYARADDITRETLRLKQIDAALAAIEVGAYGICVDCEEGIAGKRLQAQPMATRCLLCQEMEERKNGR